MADIFDEINEKLREDKAKEVWKKNGKWIIGFAILILVGVAGFNGYKAWDISKKQDAAALFFQATKDLTAEGDMAELSKAEVQKQLTSLIEQGSLTKGYSYIARMTNAYLAQESGDWKQASALYQSISEDKSIPTYSQYQARLLAIESAHRGGLSTPDELIISLDSLGEDLKKDAPELYGYGEIIRAELMLAKDQKLQATNILMSLRDNPQTSPQTRSLSSEIIRLLDES